MYVCMYVHIYIYTCIGHICPLKLWIHSEDIRSFDTHCNKMEHPNHSRPVCPINLWPWLTACHGTWPIFKQVVCLWIFHGKHLDYQRRCQLPSRDVNPIGRPEAKLHLSKVQDFLRCSGQGEICGGCSTSTRFFTHGMGRLPFGMVWYVLIILW